MVSLLLLRATYYVKVMKKIVEKGGEYVQDEIDRLGRMMGMHSWQHWSLLRGTN